MAEKEKVEVEDIIGLVKCEPTDSVKEVRKLRGRDGMTEKRLNIDLIEDLFVREELIRLYEENEQLKKELHKLKLVNEMLSMDFSNSEHELLKENEQLKKRNEFLKKQLDRVCSENEMMGDKLKKIGRIL
jgi:hypothetical protein